VELAAHRFEVCGLDGSPHAHALATAWLKDRGLHAELRLHDISTAFPYEDAYFDALLSIQVLHHAVVATIRQIVLEIERVTKAEAIVFITVPRSRNQAAEFEEIEPNTLIPLDGPEKGLPHHFFSEDELTSLFAQFEPLDVRVDSHDHLCFTGSKRGPQPLRLKNSPKNRP
jgi:SAM-dependent methyltransferase